MELWKLAAGLIIDPSKKPITASYPTSSEVSGAYYELCRYADYEVLQQASTYKELVELCPDCEHLKISSKLFPYLKASVYVEDTPAELVLQIDKILSETGCGNSVIYNLPKRILDKLSTFGYLKNGVSLNGVIQAVLGQPWYPSNLFTIRGDGIEYCVGDNKYVFVPIDVVSRYPINQWKVMNGRLMLREGVPYERKGT